MCPMARSLTCAFPPPLANLGLGDWRSWPFRRPRTAEAKTAWTHASGRRLARSARPRRSSLANARRLMSVLRSTTMRDTTCSGRVRGRPRRTPCARLAERVGGALADDAPFPLRRSRHDVGHELPRGRGQIDPEVERDHVSTARLRASHQPGEVQQRAAQPSLLATTILPARPNSTASSASARAGGLSCSCRRRWRRVAARATPINKRPRENPRHVHRSAATRGECSR